MDNTLSLVQYYQNLIIIEYQKERARATIAAQATPLLLPQTSSQSLIFDTTPMAGSLVVSFNGSSSASIAWDADAVTVATAIRAIPGLSSAVVTGTPLTGRIDVRFDGVPPVAPMLTVSGNIDTTPRVVETDLTLPLAVEGAFNLLGTDQAVGAQLDIIGKYVGVSRNAQSLSQVIRLNDDDYRLLIKMAIAVNNAKTDLASVQQFLYDFFPNQIRVFDYKNMRVSYVVLESVGSRELVEMLIAQNLLLVPMAVLLAAVLYVPTLSDFFGFSFYELPFPDNVKPFNSYQDYNTDWLWLDYKYAIYTA